MKIKELLYQFIENNWEQLPSLFKNHGRKRTQIESEVEEAIRELKRTEQEQLWESLFEFVSSHFLKKYTEKEDANLIASGAEDESEEVQEQDLELLQSVLLLASVQTDALFTENEKEQHRPPEKLVQFVTIIGEILGDLESEIQNSAAGLCEKWILRDLEEKDKIYPSTFLTLIEDSLKPGAKKQAVKRVWTLHAGLSYLPLDNPDVAQSSAGKLLLSCAASYIYVCSDEGVKFLSEVLCVPSLQKEFHNIIKNSFPDATTTQSIKYAQIYFRAWKNSQGEQKQRFEEDCIQDLMYLAVHAQHSSNKLFPNLCTFLHHIHKHKKHAPTASVIYRLYEPFIWRSLKVANGYVRTNATTILCDAYPFMDTNLTQEEKEGLMVQQHQAFLLLLLDPCHLVRIAAVKGTFKILSDYWLIMPSHIIQKMFSIYITKLAVDASSAEIRTEVIRGINQLLDCPDAGPFVTDILPRIAESFNDVNAAVRIAFMKLLLKVKATSFIKYWKLVPLEHLLIRLVCDIPNVKSLITELIQSSFLPVHLDEQEMFQRCVALVELNREAARTFYHFASKKLDLEATTKFILFIWWALHKYIQTVNSRNTSASSEDGTDLIDERTANSSQSETPPRESKKQRKVARANKENRAPCVGLCEDELAKHQQHKAGDDDSDITAQIPLDDPNIVGGLLDTIVILWTVNAPRLGLPENLKYLEALRTKTSKIFPSVWSFFKENDEISQTLLYLSSFLPSSIMPTMVGLCLSRLRSLSDSKSGSVQENSYATFVNALCNWNRADDVMELISDWLTVAFKSVLKSPQNTEKKKSKAGRVRFQEKNPPKPTLALTFLAHMLKQPINKMSLLQNHRQLLVQLCDQLSDVKKLITLRAKKENAISPLLTDELLSECWRFYLIVVTMLNCKPKSSGKPECAVADTTESQRSNESNMEEFRSADIQADNVDFILRTVNDNSNNKNYNTVAFIFDCLVEMLRAGTVLMSIGAADMEFIDLFLNFAEELLKVYSEAHSGSSLISLVCNTCEGIIEAHEYLNAYSKDNSHLLPQTSCTNRTFSHLITIVSHNCSADAIAKDEDCRLLAERLLKTILVMTEESDLLLEAVSSQIVKQIVSAVSEELKENVGAVPTLNVVTDLPTETKILILSVYKNSKLAQAFVSAMQIFFSGSELVEICDILAIVLILSLLINDCGRISLHSLKEFASAARDYLDKIEDVTLNTTQSSSSETDDTSDKNAEFFRFCTVKSKEMIQDITVSLGLQ